MAGDSGGQTSGVQESTTLTDLPEWYKRITQQLGSQVGGQLSNFGALSNQVMAGGVAPQGGVFGGGATVAPQQPANIPQPYTTNYPHGGSTAGYVGGGNGMGSGIGSMGPVFGAGMSSGGTSPLPKAKEQ